MSAIIDGSQWSIFSERIDKEGAEGNDRDGGGIRDSRDTGHTGAVGWDMTDVCRRRMDYCTLPGRR